MSARVYCTDTHTHTHTDTHTDTDTQARTHRVRLGGTCAETVGFQENKRRSDGWRNEKCDIHGAETVRESGAARVNENRD